MPTVLLDDEYWQVESIRLTDNDDIELHRFGDGKTKKVSDVDIEKRDAYKLLCAVFDNTEHYNVYEEKDYEDVEDFYGWELS